jgi:hypothetical protein
MTAQKIGSWLASGELRTLSSKAQRLTELQQVLFDSAPPPLAQACRVKNYEAGTLSLLADNAAVAAKLKHLAPRLLLNFQTRVPEITGIRIEVLVKHLGYETQARIKNSSLQIDSIEHFKRLSETIPDSPLKLALSNLVRRHRRRNPNP